MNRSKPIQHTLWELERQFGAGVLIPAAQLRGRYLSTGYPALDALLTGGGIAAGQMTAVSGTPTSGATTLVYRLIAQAQHAEGISAFIDHTGTFDAESAVAQGVQLDRLLLITARTAERGINMALDLIRTDTVALIALDWAEGALSASTIELLRANIVRTRSALVVLRRTLPPLGGVYTALQFDRLGWLNGGDERISGYCVGVRVLRDAGNDSQRTTRIDILLHGERP